MLGTNKKHKIMLFVFGPYLIGGYIFTPLRALLDIASCQSHLRPWKFIVQVSRWQALCGGFHSHRGTPIVGWVIMENTIQMDEFLCTPISGHLHVNFLEGLLMALVDFR